MFELQPTARLTEHGEEGKKRVNGEEIVTKYCARCKKWISTGQNTDGEWGNRSNKWLAHIDHAKSED